VGLAFGLGTQILVAQFLDQAWWRWTFHPFLTLPWPGRVGYVSALRGRSGCSRDIRPVREASNLGAKVDIHRLDIMHLKLLARSPPNSSGLPILASLYFSHMRLSRSLRWVSLMPTLQTRDSRCALAHRHRCVPLRVGEIRPGRRSDSICEANDICRSKAYGRFGRQTGEGLSVQGKVAVEVGDGAAPAEMLDRVRDFAMSGDDAQPRERCRMSFTNGDDQAVVVQMAPQRLAAAGGARIGHCGVNNRRCRSYRGCMDEISAQGKGCLPLALEGAA
jgi:hypothetical protein